MTKDEVLKLAQEVCPYFDEQLKGAFYEGVIRTLDQLPDATKMIDTGIDRGAWSDVPDATKWVDELRGDEEPPNSTTDVVEPEKPAAWSVRNRLTGTHWYTHESKYTAQYYANLYSHRESDGYPTMEVTPLYTAPPSKPWVSLTDAEIVKASIGNVEGEHMLPHSFARAIEKLLREKNCD